MKRKLGRSLREDRGADRIWAEKDSSRKELEKIHLNDTFHAVYERKIYLRKEKELELASIEELEVYSDKARFVATARTKGNDLLHVIIYDGDRARILDVLRGRFFEFTRQDRELAAAVEGARFWLPPNHPLSFDSLTIGEQLYTVQETTGPSPLGRPSKRLILDDLVGGSGGEWIIDQELALVLRSGVNHIEVPVDRVVDTIQRLQILEKIPGEKFDVNHYGTPVDSQTYQAENWLEVQGPITDEHHTLF